jgi:aspartyl-tRNA(Asn)/glutamyl-tRNA(Gln) amidotransferase subunit C
VAFRGSWIDAWNATEGVPYSICYFIFRIPHSSFRIPFMSLTRDEVEKVSLLGRLLLTEEELSRMTEQLGAILEYMELLGEVDTTAVEPMAHAVELANVFRPDAAQPSLDREAALSNAPHRDAECYLVPAVLGEV